MQTIRTTKGLGVAAAITLLVLGLILASIMATRGQDNDRGIVADLISRALSTPSSQVSIGEVSGALSSDVTIRNISIADRDGVWLELDVARLVWRRTALLFRRLEIERLEVGALTIHRQPVPSQDQEKVSDQPIFPELPVKIEVQAFALKQLTLGEPLLGTAARLGATGTASLGDPSEGLRFLIDARRLDAPGSFGARLSYVPSSGDLNMAVMLNEPEGGILVRALGLPEQPPANLNLEGNGTLEDFDAKLAFAAGKRIGAEGSARLARQGDARQLTLDLAARVEGLLPEAAQPVFADVTQLNAGVRFADDGTVTVKPLSVVSQLARMDIAGELSAKGIADFTMAVRSIPNAKDRVATDDVELGSLTFDATVRGEWTGPQVEAQLALRNGVLPQGRIRQLDARFEAKPSGSVTEKGTSVPMSATVDAKGIRASDPALARAIGSSLSLEMAGTSQDGIVDVETLRLRTETARADFKGRIGGPRIEGRANVEAPDLARFGDVAGLDLRGALNLRADLEGVPDESRISAALDGRVTKFASGLSAVDGLAGQTVTLNGVVRTLPDGGFGFQDLNLRGAHASARLNGDATSEAAAIDATATIPDLRRADPRLTGRAQMRARITGTLERPDADATIDIADATALKRPIPSLVLRMEASDITGLIDARATLTGTIDRSKASGTFELARQREGGWRLGNLDLRIGSVSARGALATDALGLADGKLVIAARDLNDLSPLVLTPMAGRLDADVALSAVEGGQGAIVKANGRGIRFGEAAIERLDANLTVTDAWRRPVIDGNVSVDRAEVAGETISQVRLVSRGTPQGSDISLDAKARGFDVAARGRIVPADDIRLELASLSARRDRHRLSLAKPATLTLTDDGVVIRGFVLSLDNGTIAIDGRAGSTFDLAVAARAVPLSAADIVQPGLGLSGTLNAEAKVSGTAEAPAGSWQLSIARLSAPQTRDSGLPAIDIKGSGNLAKGRSTVNATLNAPGAGSMQVSGSVPLQGTGDLDLALKGRIDLAVANAQLAASGRRLAGRADVDLRVGGSTAQPLVNGGITISDARFDDATFGVQLTAINGRITARGETIGIERLSARTPNGGTIAVSGQVEVDPAAGMPGTIRIAGQRAALVSHQWAEMVASLNVTISGPLIRDPQISGRIDIASLDLTVPERLPSTSRPLPGTRHIAPPPHVRAVLAARSRAEQRADRAPPFDASLDLTLSAPNRVFVRGRGIDAELGGQLRLTGRLSDPITNGAFSLRRGRLSIIGTRLDFTRGDITFAGGLTPNLDFLAETRAGDVTAYIAVTGSATQPSFAFSSSPDLPQDEVLSRILFSKASGSLSPFQALQLAQAAAQFAGAGGPDTFEQIRRSLGVDTIDISTGTSGDPTVGVSRAINNRVSVGVRAGSSTEDTGVTLDIDLTRRLRLQGAAYGNGNTSLGIGAEIEY